MSCRSVTDLLHREVDALDETERLMLEDHLAICERCRGDRARLQLLRRAAAELTVPPAGSRVYSRAIARALLDGRASEAAPSTSRRRIAAAAAFAVVAVLVIVAIARRAERSPGEMPTAALPAATAPSAGDAESSPATAATGAEPSAASTAPPETTAAAGTQPERAPSGPPTPAPASGGPAPAAIVEDGALIAPSTGVVRRAPIPPDTLLRAPRPVRLRVGSYRVVVAASSEFQWSATDRALRLFRGSLDVDGTGTAAGRPRVVTERFEVELDDAALTVDPTAVRVRRGGARVVDRAHRVLAHVEAGRTWSSAPPAAPATATASAADLLAQARAGLAAHDHAAAAETASRALAAAASSRSDRAEARMLIADVAQASGALDRAVAQYLEVAAEFDELPVAESALYAAARIELHRSRTAAARAVLERYLARFPTGRYADDARRELAHP